MRTVRASPGYMRAVRASPGVYEINKSMAGGCMKTVRASPRGM